MNRFLLFAIVSFQFFPLFSQNNSNTLLLAIDKTIQNNSYYTKKKEHEINQLKASLKHTVVPEQKYTITQKLYNEYQSYQSDSALVYARKNFQIAENLNNLEKLNQAKFNLVSIMGTLGMYKEGIDVLNTITITSTPNLKGSFNGVSRVVYGQMADNASSQQEKEKYLLLSKKYRDSCISFYPSNSTPYIIAKADWYLDNKKPEETLDLLLSFLKFTKTILTEQ